MERISAALQCQRLTCSHTYDVLAHELENIHSEYGFGNKIWKTATDNGAVFGNDNVTNTDEIDINSDNEDDDES